jgi:hypothetical protein
MKCLISLKRDDGKFFSVNADISSINDIKELTSKEQVYQFFSSLTIFDGGDEIPNKFDTLDDVVSFFYFKDDSETLLFWDEDKWIFRHTFFADTEKKITSAWMKL